MTAEARFDEVVHAPHRLKILALLNSTQTAEFGVLRDELQVSDPTLSKQLKVLTDAGYASLDKPSGQIGRARTWVKITPAGRRAFQGHLAALQALVDAAVPTRTQA